MGVYFLVVLIDALNWRYINWRWQEFNNRIEYRLNAFVLKCRTTSQLKRFHCLIVR